MGTIRPTRMRGYRRRFSSGPLGSNISIESRLVHHFGGTLSYFRTPENHDRFVFQKTSPFMEVIGNF
jgi:hypothetical protein